MHEYRGPDRRRFDPRPPADPGGSALIGLSILWALVALLCMAWGYHYGSQSCVPKIPRVPLCSTDEDCVRKYGGQEPLCHFELDCDYPHYMPRPQ